MAHVLNADSHTCDEHCTGDGAQRSSGKLLSIFTSADILGADSVPSGGWGQIEGSRMCWKMSTVAGCVAPPPGGAAAPLKG